MVRKFHKVLKRAFKTKASSKATQSIQTSANADHFIPLQIVHLLSSSNDVVENVDVAEPKITLEVPITSDLLKSEDADSSENRFITELAHCLHAQLKLFHDYIISIKDLNNSTQKESVVEFVLKKMENTNTDEIDRIIESSKLNSPTDSLNYICDVIDHLYILNSEQSANAHLYTLNNQLDRHIFDFDKTQKLKQYLEQALKLDVAKNSINKIKHAINTIDLNIYFESEMLTLINLIKFDYDKVNEALINPINSDNVVVGSIINNASIPISTTDIDNLSSDLNKIKDNTLNYIKLYLEIIANQVDNITLKKFKDNADLLYSCCKINDIILNMRDIFNSHKTQDGIAEIADLCEHLENHIQNLMHTLARFRTTYNIGISSFLLKLSRGDFFNTKDFLYLQDGLYSLFNYINSNQYIDLMLITFGKLNEVQAEKCIESICFYLKIDTECRNISSKYEHSAFIIKLNLFNHLVSFLATTESIRALLNNLSNTIIEKIIAKDKQFSNYVSNIKNNLMPPNALLFRLNEIYSKFDQNRNDMGVIEEQAIEVLAMVQSSVPWSTNDNIYLREFNEVVNHYCLKLNNIGYLADISSTILNHCQNPNTNHSNENIDFHHCDIDILLMLSEVANAKYTVTESQNAIEKFYTQLNNGFLNRYCKISYMELADKNWAKDNERIEHKRPLAAPNIRNYQQYSNLISKFVSFSILYSVEYIYHIEPRSHMQQIRLLHNFYKKLENYASEKNNAILTNAIHNGLSIPLLTRLNLSEINEVQNTQIKMLNKNALKLCNYTEIVPPITQVLQSFEAYFNKQYKNETEFFVTTGRKLRDFDQTKSALLENKTIDSDPTYDMVLTFQKMGLYVFPYQYHGIILNEKKLIEIMQRASMDIKPTVYAKHSIREFVSISDLKNHLHYCEDREIDYLISEKNPKNEILNFITQHVNEDEDLIHVEEVISLLSIIKKIEISQSRKYDYDNDLSLILSSYLPKASRLLHNDNPKLHTLEEFFNIFNSYERIKSIKAQIKENAVTGVHSNLLKIITDTDALESEFKRFVLIHQEEKRQNTYTELLGKILEGNTSEGFIPFKKSNTVEDEASSTSLLPESEYPVPLAEPEHPNYIGINRTMNFNPPPLPSSVLSLFATRELTQDFLRSFKWACKVEDLRVLERSKFDPSTNLLGVQKLFSPEAQLSVMNLVLVALDTISKISGQSGIYAIHNFTAIKEINDRLSEITQVLTSHHADNEIVVQRANRLIHAVYDLNRDCYVLIKENKRYPIEDNPYMNELCHINEHLIHRILGIDYRSSVLTPISTKSNYYVKISAQLKHEIPAEALVANHDIENKSSTPFPVNDDQNFYSDNHNE